MVARTFHMDPVDVWKGSDYDVAFRVASLNRVVELMAPTEEPADG